MISRDELSRLLTFVRGDLTQMEAAALSGLSQAKISRRRNGAASRCPPSKPAGTPSGSGPPPSNESGWSSSPQRVPRITSRDGVALVRVAASVQERIERLQRDARVIHAWPPNLVPGVLQTPEFTAALLAGEGDPGPAWWTARRARTAMLSEPGRSWHLLVSETALRWTLGSAATMRAQIEHLVSASELPTIRLGVLDLSTPKPFAPPAVFHVYGRVVSVATEVGTSFLTGTADVEHIDGLFARLDAAALHGDDARDLLNGVAQQSEQ